MKSNIECCSISLSGRIVNMNNTFYERSMKGVVSAELAAEALWKRPQVNCSQREHLGLHRKGGGGYGKLGQDGISR